MNCTINDINLPFDKEDRLKDTVARVAKHDTSKAVVLSALFEDDNFKKFVVKNNNELVLKNETVDFDNLSSEDYVKFNQNKLGALLNVYYLEHYFSVDNSKTNKSVGRLNGFSSGSAKTIAKQHTATLIIDEYSKELSKPKSKRRTRLEIISDVNSKLLRTFYDRVNSFCQYIESNDKFSKEAKEYARKYIEVAKRIQEINEGNSMDADLLNSIQIKGNEIVKKRNEVQIIGKNAAKTKNKEEFDKAVAELKNLNAQIAKLNEDIASIKKNIAERNKNGTIISRDKYVLAQNLIDLYSKEADDTYGIRLRNFANLVAQTRGDANGWYFQVFHTKTMTSIIKEFNNVGDIEEYLEQEETDDDSSFDKFNDQSIDDTTKSWEDSLYKNASQAVSGRVRMILSSIPKLAGKYNDQSDVQNLDTNNELGVQTYMTAQYIISQIFTFANPTSVDTFISSLEKVSNTIKSLYGVGQVVAMMKNNRVFANEMFASFAKPIAHKTMLTISDIANQNGTGFSYSNISAFPVADLVFRMANKIRSTFTTSYNINDIESLKQLRRNRKYNKMSKENYYDAIFDLLNKYFPGFNKDVFNSFVANSSEREIELLIFNRLRTIIEEIGKYKNSINRAEEKVRKNNYKNWVEYFKKVNDYNHAIESGAENATMPEKPENEYVDYSSFDLGNNLYRELVMFARQFVNYTESRARLNTSNAEGHSASDVLKNCYITRFFEMINSESEEDSNAGLRALLEYVTQGTRDGRENQYSHNPILFGVRDEQGDVIIPGMFTRTADGYEINKNAKEILKYSLFDGSKNTQDNNGVTYSQMNKLDFFITQYLAFYHSTDETSDYGRTNDIADSNVRSAVYSMRIGSDAPKIFFIRAPRYDRTNVERALYGHVLDELDMFVKGINSLFERSKLNDKDGEIWLTKTNVKNLLGRAFYNEKEADKIARSGGTDFTKAIVSDERLVGNLFSFHRLFNLDGYDANEAIQSVLSLYGGNGKAGFINADTNGRLRLDLSNDNAIVYDEAREEFVLKLNAEQENKLRGIVHEWCERFVAEAKDYMSEFADILKNNNVEAYNEETFESFALNSVLMNISYDDLFEGDYKYYNGARDFLKRTKESQAGGDGYAGYDILKDSTNEVHELEVGRNEKEVIRIDSTRHLDDNGSPVKEDVAVEGRQLVARNGFRAVTIYNTVKASDYAVQMQEELERIFLSQGMKPEIAHRLSVKSAAGYGFSQGETQGDVTKINDAQSYITLDEFIRRKYADGTINDYAGLIEQLTDDTPVDKIDLDEVNARIQVQKNFYYDKVFDSATGLYYPRQIKNAEFVLVPKLLPEGSELKRVYDFMVANGIDQLNTAETSKAAKKNVFTIWDAETGELDEDFEKKFDNDYVEEYKYQYLYKQQDVPQHMEDASNKAGSQIVKKVIDNIINENDEDNPKRKELKKYADEFIDAYTTNIEESFTEFMTTMGWEYDSKLGKIVNREYATTDANGQKLPDDVIATNRETLNFSYFLSRAREEAARLGMDSNFIEYFIPNEFGKPIMPNWLNNCSSKLESIAQAIYNRKITRQTFPGWHAAQITGVGYSKKLEFDPKTGVMQVYLPRWSKLIPRGRNAEEEAEILKQIQEEGLDIHIGYRIPTEGGQSVSVLKVVGFTNECLGSTIVVPDDWVRQTGSDFDVDSIYGISFEMYATRDKSGKISLHKIPYEEGSVNDEELYIRYVNGQLETRVKRTDVGEEIDNKVKEIKDDLGITKRTSLSKEYGKLNKERDALYAQLPNWAKRIVMDVNKKNKRLKDGKRTVDIQSAYPAIATELSNYLSSNEVDEATKEIVGQYVDYTNGLVGIMKEQDGLPAFDKEAYRSQKAEAIREIVENSKKKYFEDVCKKAKEAGIMSFDEFVNQPHLKKLDRRARNNFIIDRMLKIISDESFREAQYSRSNFEDIVNGENGANDIIDDISGESSRNRSPYNPFDQLDYFEDAMGGARLKARSVNWDRFISVNNKVRASLSEENAVDVILTVGEKSAVDSIITYDEEGIRESYGEDVEEYKPNVNNVSSSTGNQVKWAQYANNNYEVSTAGDERFSAKIAKFNAGTTITLHNDKGEEFEFKVGNLTIEDVYQNLVKKSRKGLPPSKDSFLYNKDEEYSYKYGYLPLWKKWAEQNPKLIEELSRVASGKTLTDKFANTNVSQARALADIINEKGANNTESDTTNDNINTPAGKRKVLLKARRLGWSNDNRNTVGRLTTIYASETTAHHLVAVKMGSVPNVNEYTFGVYKLLTGLGIDYETTIGFIRQPVITRLVRNNNLINSVFISSSNNPINMTLADIANELGLKNGKYDITYNTNIQFVITALCYNNELRKAFGKLFGIDIAMMSKKEKFLKIKVPLDKERLFTRIKREARHKGDKYENAAFDLAMLLTFRNIQQTAYKIEKLITVTNADKFGAQNSLHETRRTVERVNELRKDRTLAKYNIPMVDLVYPTVNGNTDAIDVENSDYKSIAAVYAYATLHSLRTNTEFFITEDDDFAEAERHVRRYIGRPFTEDEYKEYKRYAITYLFNSVSKLLTPLEVDDAGRIIPSASVLENENNSGETSESVEYWNKERSRICGYGISTDGDFVPEDLNNPTDNDIATFSNLTPAQKVIFIQRHFPDNQGLFNYIKVSLFNSTVARRSGVSRQYLSYDDQIDDIEDLYDLFNRSFFNRNKFIKLAAIDLVKYAFIAEGFNFRSGNITQIIPNSVLYTSREEGGFDIINNQDNANSLTSLINSLPAEIQTDEFVENFVRSHSSMVPLVRLYALPKKVIDQFGEERYAWNNTSTAFKHITRLDGIVHFDATISHTLLNSLMEKTKVMERAGGYVRINFPVDDKTTKTVLYKIEARNPTGDSYKGVSLFKDYFLIPLNLLDKYETYEYSYNRNFNVNNSREYYNAVVEKLAEGVETARTKKVSNPRIKASENVFPVVFPVGQYESQIIDLNTNPTGLMYLSEHGDEYTKGAVRKLIESIQNHIGDNLDNVNDVFIKYSGAFQLSKLIPAGKSVRQTIETNSGVYVDVEIEHQIANRENDFANKIRRIQNGEVSAKDAGMEEYQTAIQEITDSNTLPEKAHFYRITKAKQSEEEQKNTVLKAATELITDGEEEQKTRL